jgi:hypothetical protein
VLIHEDRYVQELTFCLCHRNGSNKAVARGLAKALAAHSLLGCITEAKCPELEPSKPSKEAEQRMCRQGFG